MREKKKQSEIKTYNTVIVIIIIIFLCVYHNNNFSDGKTSEKIISWQTRESE